MSIRHRIHPGKCPHCGQDPVLKPDSRHLYSGRYYGPVWECVCGAYCGCHRGTIFPLGTVADRPTRDARKQAHIVFDRLWRGNDRQMNRRQAYNWLRLKMGLSHSKCHIAMFSIEQAMKAIELCKNFNPNLEGVP